MDRKQIEFTLEYRYTPSLDAEEALAQAYNLILALILEDIQLEQEQNKTC